VSGRVNGVRTLLVDDEPLARRRVRALLAREPDVEIVGEAANGDAAVRSILELRPDLVLLDIQMPGKDGFDVLAGIANEHQPVVVFITAHDEHALRAFEVEAVDYVLKPIVEDRLRAAVRRAVGRVRERSRGDIDKTMARLLLQVRAAREPERLAIKRDGRVIFVAVVDIDWVDADGDIARIHAGRETHLMRATMADLEAKLEGRELAEPVPAATETPVIDLMEALKKSVAASKKPPARKPAAGKRAAAGAKK